MPEVALTALRCRTSDRLPGGARGAEALARELCSRLGIEPELVGTPGPARTAGYDEDLRDARTCLRDAGARVERALAADRVPILTASDCSICLTTLPAAARAVDGLRVLWVDAHGDFNTPATTPSGFLGGMCLAGACGRWDAGVAETALDPEAVILCGARDVDEGEREELVDAGVRVLDDPARVTLGLAGAPVYVHLDVDVLDPAVLPAQFPVPGGLGAGALRALLADVAQAADRIAGLEITAFEAPEDAAERARLTTLVADAAAPLLP